MGSGQLRQSHTPQIPYTMRRRQPRGEERPSTELAFSKRAADRCREVYFLTCRSATHQTEPRPLACQHLVYHSVCPQLPGEGHGLGVRRVLTWEAVWLLRAPAVHRGPQGAPAAWGSQLSGAQLDVVSRSGIGGPARSSSSAEVWAGRLLAGLGLAGRRPQQSLPGHGAGTPPSLSHKDVGTVACPSAHFVHARCKDRCHRNRWEEKTSDKKVPRGSGGLGRLLPRDSDCGWLCGPCGKPLTTTRACPRGPCAGTAPGGAGRSHRARGPWGLFLSPGPHCLGAAPGALGGKRLWGARRVPPRWAEPAPPQFGGSLQLSEGLAFGSGNRLKVSPVDQRSLPPIQCQQAPPFWGTGKGETKRETQPPGGRGAPPSHTEARPRCPAWRRGTSPWLTPATMAGWAPWGSPAGTAGEGRRVAALGQGPGLGSSGRFRAGDFN